MNYQHCLALCDHENAISTVFLVTTVLNLLMLNAVLTVADLNKSFLQINAQSTERIRKKKNIMPVCSLEPKEDEIAEHVLVGVQTYFDELQIQSTE